MKASFTLQNGTVINVDGNLEEVKSLLDLYGETTSPSPLKRAAKAKGKREKPASLSSDQPKVDADSTSVPLTEIISVIKDCDEADDIERRVLDKTSQINRTLLPLYIAHEYFENKFDLTSGDVSKITTDLGVPISTPNASRTLSGTARRYVIGDSTRKKGQVVRYKLSRRGVTYMKSVIQGTSGEN